MRVAGETNLPGVKSDDPVITLKCETCESDQQQALTSMGLKCLSCGGLYFAANAAVPFSGTMAKAFGVSGVIQR